METLEDFLLKREDLALKISKLNGILGRLGLSMRSEMLHLLEEDCLNTQFRILIAGEFKRGKSCLVNALLGDNILPMKVAPCTTTISEVSYGEVPKTTVYSKRIRTEVPFENRFTYCTIQGQKELSESEKPIDKVEIHYPSSVCKKGLTLIDSPGLNEDWSRTQTSLREIAQADIIILVLSCEMALSQSEQQFIQSHLLPYRKRVFFLWNRADAIWDNPAEEASLRQRSQQHLEQFSPHIYFVSAREALLGQLQHNDTQFQKSNIPLVIEKIEQFIVQNQVQSKLESVWQQAMQLTTYALYTVIPRMEHLLTQPLETLKQYAIAVDVLQQEESEKLTQVQAAIERAKTEILASQTQLLEQFIADIPKRIVDDSAILTFPPRLSRQEREDIIIDWFNQWLQQALHRFTQETVKQSLETHIETAKLTLDGLRTEHVQSIEKSIGIDTDEHLLFSGRWVQETSLLVATALSLMLLKLDRDRVAEDLLKVRAIRGWLIGSTLTEGDRLKLGQQLQRSVSNERAALLRSQDTYLSETMSILQETLQTEMKRIRKDVEEQLKMVISLHSHSKQDTHIEQQQLQLETLRLSVHNVHTQLRTLLQNI